jgi:hypothetical protein
VSGASSVEELKRLIALAGFQDLNIRTEPVSAEYEQKWGSGLTVGEYIMSAKISASKPL